MNLGRVMVTVELELEILEAAVVSFGDDSYIFERSFICVCATEDKARVAFGCFKLLILTIKKKIIFLFLKQESKRSKVLSQRT